MNLSWAYGDPPPHEDKVRLLNEALDLGYDHLDTANIYGKGANEDLLSDAVMHRRDEFLLPARPASSSMARAAESIARPRPSAVRSMPA